MRMLLNNMNKGVQFAPLQSIMVYIDAEYLQTKYDPLGTYKVTFACKQKAATGALTVTRHLNQRSMKLYK